MLHKVVRDLGITPEEELGRKTSMVGSVASQGMIQRLLGLVRKDIATFGPITEAGDLTQAVALVRLARKPTLLGGP
jgi:hypothetical protein